MKKHVVSMLIVLIVATPCLAEIEPDGIFSLHGTRWQALPIGLQILPFPFIWPTDDLQFRFYGGEVSPGLNDSFYIDMLVCSIFWGVDRPGSRSGGTYWYSGILQPIGIGMVVKMVNYPIPSIKIGLLIKIDDNWIPPEFSSISPDQGKQETTLTDVTITGVNTYFESGVDDIIFTPPDGITISNINVISNTEIEFDLDIAVDAPIGVRTVIAIYDDRGILAIVGNDVFEVLEKTN